MPILMVALQSDKRSLLELSEIAELTVKEQLQTIADLSIAVSYTHLEVYKRQGNITIYPLLQQTPQTNCLAGDMAETSYVPRLSG